jgi:hypothetical protein
MALRVKTVVKEISPTSFAVEQTVKTMTRAKTLTLDSKTQMVPDSFSILLVGK